MLDTRAGATACDAPGASIPGATARAQTAAGRSCDGLSIPANARAVTGNITTVQSGGGYLTLSPADAAQPLAANSNYNANQILNNAFTVGLGAGDGAFKIHVTSDTHVVVDITGYFAPPGAGGRYFHPLPRPVRLLDTRAGQKACYMPGAPLPGMTETTQRGQGMCDGMFIPAAAKALAGNATTVNPGAGYLTMFPADVSRPPISSSNFQTGEIMNAPFVVGLSATGSFRLYPSAQTHLVIDVLGYYSAEALDANGTGLLYTPLSAPVRLLDTRPGATGCYLPATQLPAATTWTQNARGVCGPATIPATALAITGNATVVGPAASGYLTFRPADATRPLVATSNFISGQIFNRSFTTGLGKTSGAFKMYSSATTHLVIDLAGYFAP
ncbi:MAG: hypothetical protein ACKV2V_01695 [Blastocatellia bacterium]